ncbi:MAG: DUF805 domain-containing protein [Flavobacteriia bacterium]|nr:DUF805 domain-containing protein [Flavobacteriia bacterium]
MNAYIRVMTEFAKFEGRLSRRDYWIFVLVTIGILIATVFIGGLLFNEELFMITYYAVIVVHFIPLISADVRRMHDIGKSGVWWFIRFVPLIGGIWFFILTLMDGDKGPNQYGPDPRSADDSFARSDENILDNQI